MSSKNDASSWLDHATDIADSASRFTLPMDMKVLENLTPLEYLHNYCIVSSLKTNLYQKTFIKLKDKSGYLLLKDLDKALKEVLINRISSDQVQAIADILNIKDETHIDYKMFSVIAAFAERMIYPQFFVKHPSDMENTKKKKIEIADFDGLRSKLEGIRLNPSMEKVMDVLK